MRVASIKGRPQQARGGDSPQRRKLDQKKVSLATLCQAHFLHTFCLCMGLFACQHLGWHKAAKLTFFGSNLRLCGESPPWGMRAPCCDCCFAQPFSLLKVDFEEYLALLSGALAAFLSAYCHMRCPFLAPWNPNATRLWVKWSCVCTSHTRNAPGQNNFGPLRRGLGLAAPVGAAVGPHALPLWCVGGHRRTQPAWGPPRPLISEL